MGILIIPAHKVLVKIKWNDTRQGFITRPSTQWMAVMIKVMTASESIVTYLTNPVSHHAHSPPWNLLFMTVTAPQTFPSLSQHWVFPHAVPFACLHLLTLSKLFISFQRCSTWNHHLWGPGNSSPPPSVVLHPSHSPHLAILATFLWVCLSSSSPDYVLLKDRERGPNGPCLPPPIPGLT